MEAGIWKTRTSLFLVVGLLVLAGVFSEVDVAWAQSQGECEKRGEGDSYDLWF